MGPWSPWWIVGQSEDFVVESTGSEVGTLSFTIEGVPRQKLNMIIRILDHWMSNISPRSLENMLFTSYMMMKT